MQIAKASIFSGLNNLYTDSIFDTRFEEYWGFSEDEVRKLCSDFGDPGKFPEMKEWYDGYRFGTRDAYNPWSVLSYVDNGFRPDTYWANVSANGILSKLYRRTNIDNFKHMLELLEGGSFVTTLNTQFTYDDTAEDDRAMYSLMAMSGYLKAVPVSEERWTRQFEVSFPNKEVITIMKDTIKDMRIVNTYRFDEFCNAVYNGNTAEMERTLGNILVQGSYFELTDETSYELVLMTVLFGIADQYRIRTESEGGNGRVDVIMEARRSGLANIIFELKKVDTEEKLEKAAEEAIEQIHDRRYYLGMEGTVLLYGISFWGKVPCMKHDRIEIPLQ